MMGRIIAERSAVNVPRFEYEDFLRITADAHPCHAARMTVPSAAGRIMRVLRFGPYNVGAEHPQHCGNVAPSKRFIHLLDQSDI